MDIVLNRLFTFVVIFLSKGVLCVCLSSSALTVALVGSQGSLS